MRSGIELTLADNGQPVAHVPCESAWDLVEYLANQRVPVQYSFEASHVLVRFTHATMASAASMLEHWSQDAERSDHYRPAPAAKAPAHA